MHQRPTNHEFSWDSTRNTYEETKQFICDKLKLDAVDCAYKFGKAETLHMQIDNLDLQSLGIDAYNITGCDIETLAAVGKESPESDSTDSSSYATRTVSGDGTVPVVSSRAVSVPAGKQYYISNKKHANLPSAAKEIILNILNDQNNKNASLTSFSEVCNDKAVYPASFLVDSQESEVKKTLDDIKAFSEKAVEKGEETTREGIEKYDNAVHETLEPVQAASQKGLEKFDDILQEWAIVPISKLLSLGIINGKTETSFAPNDFITRAEALKMVLELKKVNIPLQELTCKFGDVSNEAWYFKYFAVGETLGIISGVDGKAYPNNNLTRAEALKLLALTTGVDVAKYQGKGWFTDVLFSNWSSPYVVWAKEKGIVNGYANGTLFKPDEPVTRAEFSKMSALAFGL